MKPFATIFLTLFFSAVAALILVKFPDWMEKLREWRIMRKRRSGRE